MLIKDRVNDLAHRPASADAAPGELRTLGDVHDRAPVILVQSEWARWLDLDADVDDLLTSSPPDLYRVRPFTEVS